MNPATCLIKNANQFEPSARHDPEDDTTYLKFTRSQTNAKNRHSWEVSKNVKLQLFIVLLVSP